MLHVNQLGKMKSNLPMKLYKYTTHKIDYNSIFRALFEIWCFKRLAKARFNIGNVSFFMVYKPCKLLLYHSGYLIAKTLFISACSLTSNITNGSMKFDPQEDVLV